MSEPRTEWRGRAHFAEIAEALNVSTDQIASAMRVKGDYVVMFSPDSKNLRDVWGTVLRRGQDGVLHETGKREHFPGFFDELDANVKRALEENPPT